MLQLHSRDFPENKAKKFARNVNKNKKCIKIATQPGMIALNGTKLRACFFEETLHNLSDMMLWCNVAFISLSRAHRNMMKTRRNEINVIYSAVVGL